MNDKQIKHLEFIQSNIARMNQNSLSVKGWAITIVSALLAIYASSINSTTGKGNMVFILVGIVPTALFWFLDSYYLQQERKFRGIYNDVAGLTDSKDKKVVREFEMPLDKYTGGKYDYFDAFKSVTERTLYLLLIAGLLAGGFLLR